MEEDNRNIEETKIDSLEGNTDGTTPVEVESTLPVVESTPIAEQTTEQIVESTPPVVESTSSVVESGEKEEPIQKKKKSPILLIVIIIVFMLFTFGLGVYFGKEVFANKEKNNKTNKENNTNTVVDNANTENNNTENNTETTPINNNGIVSEEVKEKLNYFISNAKKDIYVDGKSGMTRKEKLEMAHRISTRSSYDDDKRMPIYENLTQVTVDTIPEKYKNQNNFALIRDYDNSYRIYQLPIKVFADNYKKLFNEEYVVETNDSNQYIGCPSIFIIDQELGNMYLSNQCGTGSSDTSYIYSDIYKYESDDSYYYAYQYVALYNHITNELNKPKSNEVVISAPTYDEVTQVFENNKEKFDTLVWKFDKNLNFVSTENRG